MGALELRCAAAAPGAPRSRLPRARKGRLGVSRQVVSAAALAAKAIGGPQVALGWAGDCPRVFPALGGRRPRWRSAAPGEAIFARPTFTRLPPLGCKSQEFGLGDSGDPNKAKIAGNKKIEVMWYMGLKKCPLQGLCLVFCVLWTARGFSGDVGSLLPP